MDKDFLQSLKVSQLRALLEKSSLSTAAMLQVNANCRIIRQNKMAQRLTKLDKNDHIGEILSWDAIALVKQCIQNRQESSCNEEIDGTMYRMDVMAQHGGTLIIFQKKDGTGYTGESYMFNEVWRNIIGNTLKELANLIDPDRKAPLRKDCMRAHRTFQHIDLLHDPVTSESLPYETVDLSLLCKDVAERTEKYAHFKIALDVPETCLINVNTHLICMAIYNLLSNAIIATRRNPQGNITLSVQDHIEGVCITVKNTGEALSPAAFSWFLEGWRTQITQKDYLILSARSMKPGLGLPVVNRIAQLHSGSLMMHWSETKECLFHLNIPRIGLVSDAWFGTASPLQMIEGDSLEEIELSCL